MRSSQKSRHAHDRQLPFEVGALDVSEAKRLKELEEENRQLRQMVADLSLDNRALKSVLGRSGEPCGTQDHAQARMPHAGAWADECWRRLFCPRLVVLRGS
jgi:hypothetical protein